MATYRYVVADVFTDVPLAGNQLAVFTDARDIPEHLLPVPSNDIVERLANALGVRLAFPDR